MKSATIVFALKENGRHYAQIKQLKDESSFIDFTSRVSQFFPQIPLVESMQPGNPQNNVPAPANVGPTGLIRTDQPRISTGNPNFFNQSQPQTPTGKPKDLSNTSNNPSLGFSLTAPLLFSTASGDENNRKETNSTIPRDKNNREKTTTSRGKNKKRKRTETPKKKNSRKRTKTKIKTKIKTTIPNINNA
jgi:hypothetical protein